MVPNLLNENDKPAKLETETSHQVAEDGPYMMADVGNNVGPINLKSQSLHPPCTYETVGSLQPVQPSSAINKLPTTHKSKASSIPKVKHTKAAVKLSFHNHRINSNDTLLIRPFLKLFNYV